MPELPDVLTYVQCLRGCVLGDRLLRVRVRGPAILRTFEPPIEAIEDHEVEDVSRLGKRIVLSFSDDLHLVVHLMIAGRLQWRTKASAGLPKICQAVLAFTGGELLLTEASSKKRATMHLVRGAQELAAFSAGGLDVLACSPGDFRQVLRSENRTLKRALTDPHLFDGIGNAYSDEILHAARLSPVQLTSRVSDAEADRLMEAAGNVLRRWIEELGRRFATRFPGPGDITAFRAEFATHGRHGKPCPVCGDTIQRIRYAENETNYCPTCQTGGRVLADRSLSRLLRDDWPKRSRPVEE